MSDHSTDRSTDRTNAGSWATYAEAAERFGTTAEAIRLRCRRLHWRTQKANDGKTLVWIPEDTTVRPRVRPPGQPYVQPPDQPAGHISEISQLTALLTAEHERAGRAEQRMDEANKRAEVATALADKALLQAAEADIRAQEAEKRVVQAESRANRAESDLVSERNRADRLEMAQNKLESELEATQERAKSAEHDKASATLVAEEAMRLAAERKARGRWARLRAAWRGE